MRPAYRVQYTQEGREIHLRRDHIVTVGVALQLGKPLEDENGEPIVNTDQTDYVRGEPFEQVMIFVEGMGNVLVDEPLEDALRIWDGILGDADEDPQKGWGR